MTIKTILFDFGGVLYLTPNLEWLQRWQKLLGMDDHPEISEMLANPNESQLVRDLCLGNISEEQLWVMMAEKWRIKPRMLARIRRGGFSKRRINQPMVNLLAALQKDYQTAILSNAGDQSRKLMEDSFHLNRYVEDIIISAEEGVVKPDAEIYRIAMDRLQATPESTLFVDDMLENVEAARELGMKAIQFINNGQATQTIKACLNGGY